MRGKIGQQFRFVLTFTVIEDLKIAITDDPSERFVYDALPRDMAKPIDEHKIIIAGSQRHRLQRNNPGRS